MKNCQASISNDSMSEFTVVPVDVDKHAIQIKNMIGELAAYEQMPSNMVPSSERIALDLSNGHVHGLVAVKKSPASGCDVVVGYILYYYAYSTSMMPRWIGRYIFMEDIYVKEDCRRFGVGTAMWSELAKIACRDNIARIQWNVLNWNKTAINFYEKHGAVDTYKTDGWLTYRMNENEIHNLAHHATKNK